MGKKMELLKEEKGADDKQGGKRKLNDDEAFRKIVSAGQPRAFIERFDRIETGENESGVDAGGETGQQEEADEPKQQRQVEQVGKAKLFIRPFVENRQSDHREHDGDAERDPAGDKRLPQELQDQLPTAATHHLPNADLLTSF